MIATAPQLEIHGYCELDADQALRRYIAGGTAALRDLDGVWVIAIRPTADADDVILLSAASGYLPYYYAEVGGRLWHGRDVIDVVARSGLPWAWDPVAVADLLVLDQVLEDETVHPQVRRLPAATELRFVDGRTMLASRAIDEVYAPTRTDPADTLAALNRSVERWSGGGLALAMSAGLDSRVVLSSLLRAGRRPRLVVGGIAGSTDVEVSRAIAKSLGLPLESVPLELAGYREQPQRVAAISDGVKNAMHWHTFLYPERANLDTATTLVVGNAGECARTDFFPLGIVARAVDRLPAALVHPQYWPRRLGPLALEPAELRGLPRSLADQLGDDGRAARYRRLARLCPGGFLDGLDRFFLGQRVRAFHGISYKLYGHACATRVPFLDTAWIRRAWSLPRAWRLGSRWHRYAIQKNAPRLLEYPEGAKRPSIPVREPPLGWIPRRSSKDRPYADYAAWFRTHDFLDEVGACMPAIAEIVPTDVANAILEAQRRVGGRHKLIGMLYALANFRMAVAARTSARAPGEDVARV